jgi:hypothetical protein
VLLSPEYPRWARASALIYEMMFEEPNRQEYPLVKMPVLVVIGQSDRSVFFRRYASPEAIKPLGNWPELGRQAAKDLPTASSLRSPAPAMSRMSRSLMSSRQRWTLFLRRGFADALPVLPENHIRAKR